MFCIATVIVLSSECKTEGVSLPASLADERPNELLLLLAVGSSVGVAPRGNACRGPGKAERGPQKADRGLGKPDRGPGKADTVVRPLQCNTSNKQTCPAPRRSTPGSYTYEYIHVNVWCMSTPAQHQSAERLH